MHEIKKIPRQSHDYTLIDKYNNRENNFNRQYAHIYTERLLIYRPILIKYCEKKFGNKYEVKKLHEVKSAEKLCIVIGTIFKHMPLRPTIFKKIANDHLPNHHIGKFIKPSDSLIIEDELQRATLVGNIFKENLVIGVTLAIICCEDKQGCLFVEDYIFPPLPKQIPYVLINKPSKYVALISGLGLSNQNLRMTQIQLMIDTINGMILGDEKNPLTIEMANIVRVIIAGNSIGEDIYLDNLSTRAKYISNKICLSSFDKIKQLDDLLFGLASSVNVDIMAGPYDPANIMLPQQPLNKRLFQKCVKLSSFNSVSNPYECIIDGIRILGTSGQNIDDIYKYTDFDDRLEILENTLKWTHMAPTCPDSLPCYPFFNNEPFVMKECPHIYFAGNQAEFKWKHYQGDDGQKVLLINVPEFHKTSQMVLINISNFTCRTILFNTTL
ncbi:unnamed protein product [Gordionus sp. m RMFG-2023]|uniref:DNA polymerase delta subunit 2-like n=1 Tax=Gordionus sp. m RMFG-2023 TaxID=3053472 RepID=UPI0030E50836